ncbi:MAG: L-rhamnose mutarotase [Flavobacteriaceae bacterium]
MKKRQYAFKMKLKPGFETEYKKRHDAIWPELATLLSDAGIQHYGIFLDEETLTLFAVQDLPEDFDHKLLPSQPIVKKWWAYMADIMETNPDKSPVAIPLKQVFYLK